jgi:hypothetical protein
MMKKVGFLASIGLLALTCGQARAANDISDIFPKSNSMKPIDGLRCQCKTCLCFNCQCGRMLPIPATLCDDISCWFYGRFVKRNHEHQPRCCTPRPPEIPFDDPCPTRPRPIPLPGPSNPWPWLDPRVMLNRGS